jgi:uncharacterized membrane protein
MVHPWKIACRVLEGRMVMKKSFGFLKTTAIGGVIFLLPLVFIGILVGQVAQVVMVIAKALGGAIPVKTPLGITLIILASIAILVFACFAAGIAARRTIGKRLSQFIERNVTFFFPRYAIFKDRMAGSIGGDENRPDLKPIVVHLDDVAKIGFEVERREGEFVTVFLPGAPDPWSGSVAQISPERIEPLKADFSDVIATFEKLGRGSAKILASRAS